MGYELGMGFPVLFFGDVLVLTSCSDCALHKCIVNIYKYLNSWGTLFFQKTKPIDRISLKDHWANPSFYRGRDQKCDTTVAEFSLIIRFVGIGKPVPEANSYSMNFSILYTYIYILIYT